MLTIFSAPKPFLDSHIARIQRNAIGSWQQLGGEVEILVIGDEPGLAEAGTELGVKVVPDVKRNEEGTPLISSIFQLARSEAQYPFLCYVNADILLFEDLMDALQKVSSRFNDFLILGQRWDLDLARELTFNEGWQGRLEEDLQSRGRRHSPMGSDYFVFPKTKFEDIPAFALGRAGWDNWMIYAGRRAGFPVVDASEVTTAVHQNHDYQHLPGGKPHYRHPESYQNIHLAGGSEMIFTLQDTNWWIVNELLLRKTWFERGVIRSTETWLYLRLGPGRASRVVRLIFHPVQTFRYLLSLLRRKG